jgi:hypothetical protein
MLGVLSERLGMVRDFVSWQTCISLRRRNNLHLHRPLSFLPAVAAGIVQELAHRAACAWQRALRVSTAHSRPSRELTAAWSPGVAMYRPQPIAATAGERSMFSQSVDPNWKASGEGAAPHARGRGADRRSFLVLFCQPSLGQINGAQHPPRHP